MALGLLDLRFIMQLQRMTQATAGPADAGQTQQPDHAMGEHQIDGTPHRTCMIRRQGQVHANCAAQIPQLKPQVGVALQTSLLHIHGMQIAQMGFAIDLNLIPHFAALTPLKGFQVKLLPGIRGVGWIDGYQSRDASLNAIIDVITLHHLTQHRSRIQQCELLPIGGLHRIPRHM